MLTIEDKIKRFEELSKKAELGGGEERIAKHHAGGKKTARERILDLMDPDTFTEIDKMVTHRSTDFGMEKNKFLAMVSFRATVKLMVVCAMYLHKISPFLEVH